MTDLQIRIIQILRQQGKGGVSGKAIAKQCGVSLNTVRKEVNILREILAGNGIALKSRTACGYWLATTEAEKAAAFFRQIVRRTNNPLFGRQTSRDYKANYIVRRLLTAQRPVPMAILSDELFYSASSVKRDLKKVEAVLRDYHLTLHLKRKSGYSVEGDEWQKRVCLLSQHKLFVNLDLEDQAREPHFRRMFLMDEPEIRGIRHKVRDAILSSKILAFQMIDLRVMTNYLPLIRTRRKYTPQLRLTPEQEAVLSGSGVWEEAERILRAADGVYSLETREIAAYGMLLQAFRVITDLSCLRERELPALRREAGELIAALRGRLELEALPESERQFLCGWYGVRSKILFHVTPDEENLETVRQPNPFAEELCVELAAILEARYGAPVSLRQTLPMYFVFLSLLSGNTRRAGKYRVLVSMTRGYSYANWCAARIAEVHAEDLREVRAVEYTQLWNSGLHTCDVLLSDLRPEYVERLLHTAPDTVFLRVNGDFAGERESRELSDWLSRQAEEERRFLLRQGTVQADSLKELICHAALNIAEEENTAPVLQKELSRWLRHRAIQTRDDTLLLLAKGTAAGVTVYHLEKPLVWEERKIDRLICCVYDGKDYRAILRMEEILRGLL